MKIDILSRAKKKKFVEGHASQGWRSWERLCRSGEKRSEKFIIREYLIKLCTSPRLA